MTVEVSTIADISAKLEANSTYDDREQRAPIKAAFQNFGSEVSIAGVRYVSSSSASNIRRLTWLVLVIFGLGFAVFQIADRISYFISRPTSVDLKINSNETITFPTVTICNQNQFRKDVIASIYPGLIDAFHVIYPPFQLATNTPDYEKAYKMLPEVWEATVDWGSLYEAFKMPVEYVHQTEFDGVYLGASEAFTSVVTDAGYCYQFNSDGLHNTSNSGRDRGLRLLLFVDQKNYVYSDNLAAGFQVVLHRHFETPSVSKLGFFVNTGHQTIVKTTVKGVKELPYPHTDCLDVHDHDKYGCELICTAEYFYNKCGCKQYFWPGDYPVCSPMQTYCIDDEKEEFLASDYLRKECSCPEGCSRVYYEHGVSSAGVSTRVKSYLNQIYNMTAEDVDKDYAILDIYLSDLRYEEMSVSESYSILALLCDIGGALGLILGSTVLTVFEIGDFFFVSAWQFCFARKTKNQTSPSILEGTQNTTPAFHR